MQYLVDTIKVKKFKTCVKQNTGEKKIVQLKRDSGKCPLHPVIATLTLYPTDQNNTDFLVLIVFKRIKHIF